MMLVERFPDRIIRVDQKEYLYFGGTSYLGLATDADFQKIIKKNIKKWGSAFGSSRSANVQLSVYEKGEEALANYINSEASVTVSSGMLAGKIVLETLQEEEVTFYHYPNLHVALQTEKSIPVYIDNQLNPSLLNSKKETIVLLTDSYPTAQTIPIDLSTISEIAPQKNIILVIDESHSLGITGYEGKGEYANINFPNVSRKIMISSLGKAIGVTGGVIASDSSFIAKIKDLPSFVSAAGMNPALLASVIDGLELIKKRNRKLKKNLIFLHSLLQKNSKVLFNKDYPLLYPIDDRVYENCLNQNIVIVNFKYATPTGSLNRIVITANHKKKDLIALAKALQ